MNVLILCLLSITHGFDCTPFCTIFFTCTSIITHGIGSLKQFGNDLNGAASFFNDTIDVQIILQTLGAPPLATTKTTKNFTVDVLGQARLGGSYSRGTTGVSGVSRQRRCEFKAIEVESERDDAVLGQLSVCLC